MPDSFSDWPYQRTVSLYSDIYINSVLVQCVPTAQHGRSSGIGLGGTRRNCPVKSFVACSPHQIMFGLPNQWGWECGAMTHGGNGNSYRVLLGKHEGKRPLWRPRDQWEDNIKVDIKEIGVDYIYLAQDRDSWWVVLNMVMNLQVPWDAGNFLPTQGTVSFTWRILLHGVLVVKHFRWWLTRCLHYITALTCTGLSDEDANYLQLLWCLPSSVYLTFIECWATCCVKCLLS